MPHDDSDSLIKRRLFIGLMFFCVLAAGLFVRVDNLFYWHDHPERFYYQETPLILTQDGFYYLQLARDLLEDTYDPVDINRAIPAGVNRPTPPPLLSVLTYAVAKVTPFSLEWIALILPAFLGILLAWPVYVLGKSYGDTTTGLVAALFALLSCGYSSRTAIGWYDTDCLNVTLVCSFAALLHRFATTTTSSRYRYLLASVCCLFLGVWWWGMAIQVVAVAFFCPLAIAILLFYRPKNSKERVKFMILLGIITTVILFWQGSYLSSKISDMFLYITKNNPSPFPLVGVGVGEQKAAPLAEIAARTTGSIGGLLIALLGFVVLVFRWKKESLFLLIPAAIGAMSIFANRFIIFLAPITALGLAAIFYELWRRTDRSLLIKILAILSLSMIALPNIKELRRDDGQAPARFPFQHEAMAIIAQKTPANAVIWTSWGYGYPLEYYTKRGTIADGSIHYGKHIFILAVPLASNDYRMAANWMQFYAEKGMAGVDKVYNLCHQNWPRCFSLMRKVFAAGPEGGYEIILQSELIRKNEVEQWLSFFFPVSQRPVYLWLDIANIQLGWFYHGNWDFSKQTGQTYLYQPFTHLQESNGHIVNKELDIDLNRGIAKTTNASYPLKQVLYMNNKQYLEKNYAQQHGYRFVMNKSANSGVLMDQAISQSIASRLYAQSTYDPKYFRPIYLKMPLYQIWAVKGESFTPQ